MLQILGIYSIILEFSLFSYLRQILKNNHLLCFMKKGTDVIIDRGYSMPAEK